jgi:hypothetical protein
MEWIVGAVQVCDCTGSACKLVPVSAEHSKTCLQEAV